MKKTYFNLKTCMQTEVNWSHRNNFMLNENMYFVWKIYTYWKYNFEKKNMLIESMSDSSKNIL